METPPPFNPPPYAPMPPKKGKPGLVIAIVVIALFVCCGGPILLLGGGGIWAFNKFGSFVTCAISITETRKAILAYERDKGHFPPAANWQTEVAPYYKKVIDSKKSKNERGPFKAWNFDENLICVDNPTPTGIAYNEELAGKKLSEIKDPSSTYILFEVPQTGMSLHQKYQHRNPSTYPKFMDKPRPWLELRVAGEIEGGDSTTIHVGSETDSSSDSDGDEDTSPKATPTTPAKPAPKGDKSADKDDSV